MDNTKGVTFVNGSEFYSNNATSYGGDIYNGEGSLVVSKSWFSKSRAEEGGTFAVFGCVQ